jgi:hypothetical protein
MDGGEKELGGREGAFKVLLLVTGYRWRGWGWSLGGGGSRSREEVVCVPCGLGGRAGC